MASIQIPYICTSIICKLFMMMTIYISVINFLLSNQIYGTERNGMAWARAKSLPFKTIENSEMENKVLELKSTEFRICACANIIDREKKRERTIIKHWTKFEIEISQLMRMEIHVSEHWTNEHSTRQLQQTRCHVPSVTFGYNFSSQKLCQISGIAYTNSWSTPNKQTNTHMPRWQTFQKQLNARVFGTVGILSHAYIIKCHLHTGFKPNFWEFCLNSVFKFK